LTAAPCSCTVLLYDFTRSKEPLVTTTTYSHLRENLAEVWDTVEDTQEPMILQRRGHQDLALLPAAELAGLMETAHLLRSPKNALRLMAALTRSEARSVEPTTLQELRDSLDVPAVD
jgi:antitoxin YefM